jgi:hypothetical protein
MKPFSVRSIGVFGFLVAGAMASYWLGVRQARADDPVQCTQCCCKQVYAFGGITATQSTGYKEDTSGNGTSFSDPRLNAVVDGNGAAIPIYSNGCVHINANGPFNPLLTQFQFSQTQRVCTVPNPFSGTVVEYSILNGDLGTQQSGTLYTFTCVGNP